MGYALTILSVLFNTIIYSAGMHMALSLGGIFFLGIPVPASAGTYAMVIAQKQGLGWILSILCGLAAAMLAGSLFVWAYRRLSQDSFAVLSLSGFLAFDALLKSWDSVTGGVLGIPGMASPFSSLAALVFTQGIMTVVVLTAYSLFIRSSAGRSLRAVKESPDTLTSLGTSGKNVGSAAIFITSGLAAISAMLAIWRIRFLDPSFGGIQFLLIALTVAILAHRPRITSLLGANLLVVLIPEGLRLLHLPSVAVGHLRMLLYSVIVIALIRRMSHKSFAAERAV